MRAWLSALCVPLTLSMAIPADAQTSVDVAKLTCRGFVSEQNPFMKTVPIWLSGYLNALRHNTVIDVSALQKITDSVQLYCVHNLDAPVIEAVKRVLGITTRANSDLVEPFLR